LGVIWDFKTNSIIIKLNKAHPWAEAQEKLKNNGNDPLESRFEQGRIEILADCKSFLTDQFNPRLPRRIRERYLGK
jgi:hypothetical protein